jgi:hypothetical protein
MKLTVAFSNFANACNKTAQNQNFLLKKFQAFANSSLLTNGQSLLGASLQMFTAKAPKMALPHYEFMYILPSSSHFLFIMPNILPFSSHFLFIMPNILPFSSHFLFIMPNVLPSSSHFPSNMPHILTSSSLQ